jgi:hypothetical protein
MGESRAAPELRESVEEKSTQELIAILLAWADCRYIEAAVYFAETLKLEEPCPARRWPEEWAATCC